MHSQKERVRSRFIIDQFLTKQIKEIAPHNLFECSKKNKKVKLLHLLGEKFSYKRWTQLAEQTSNYFNTFTASVDISPKVLSSRTTCLKEYLVRSSTKQDYILRTYSFKFPSQTQLQRQLTKTPCVFIQHLTPQLTLQVRRDFTPSVFTHLRTQPISCRLTITNLNFYVSSCTSVFWCIKSKITAGNYIQQSKTIPTISSKQGTFE